MTFDMGNNTNKLILLVVAAVALLLALNIYQKQLGKNVAIVLAVVTIVVVVGVGVSLMTQNGSANNNARNNAPINNVVEGFYGDEEAVLGAGAVEPKKEDYVAVAGAGAGLGDETGQKYGGMYGDYGNDSELQGQVSGVDDPLTQKELNNVQEEADAALKACLEKAAENKNAQAKCMDGFTGSRKRREHFEGNNNATTAAGNNNATTAAGNNNATTAAGNNNNNPVTTGVMKCTDLLPGDTTSTWAQVSPAGIGSLCDKNLLNAGHHVGVNTKGTSLRNANRGLRSEPPCPQVNVSPWLQTTIAPDLLRRPLE